MLACLLVALLAAEVDAADVNSLYERGVAAGLRGRMASAEKLFRRALAVDPWHIPARRGLDLVSDVTNGACDRDTAHMVFQGLTFESRLQWPPARLQYERAIAAAPGYYLAHHNLAQALFETGHLEEAVAELEETIRLKPDYPYTHNNLGLALDRLGEHERALVAYRRAVEIEPGYYKAWKNIGVGQRHANRPAEAQEALARALDVYPDYPLAYINAELSENDEARISATLQGQPVHAVVEIVARGSWQERKVAQRLLAGQRSPDTCKTVAGLLGRPEVLARFIATRVLADPTCSAMARPLYRTVKGDGEYVVRREAGLALGAIGSDRAKKYLVRGFTRERDDLVRLAFAYELGRTDCPQAFEALILAANDRVPLVQNAVRIALDGMDAWPPQRLSRRALSPLRALLADERPLLRARAATALGEQGTKRAVTPLREAADDPDPTVREAVEDALAHLKGRSRR